MYIILGVATGRVHKIYNHFASSLEGEAVLKLSQNN